MRHSATSRSNSILMRKLASRARMKAAMAGRVGVRATKVRAVRDKAKATSRPKAIQATWKVILPTVSRRCAISYGASSKICPVLGRLKATPPAKRWGRAGDAMDGAEEALRQDDFAEALDQQSEAMEALREGNAQPWGADGPATAAGPAGATVRANSTMPTAMTLWAASRERRVGSALTKICCRAKTSTAAPANYWTKSGRRSGEQTPAGSRTGVPQAVARSVLRRRM